MRDVSIQIIKTQLLMLWMLVLIEKFIQEDYFKNNFNKKELITNIFLTIGKLIGQNIRTIEFSYYRSLFLLSVFFYSCFMMFKRCKILSSSINTSITSFPSNES